MGKSVFMVSFSSYLKISTGSRIWILETLKLDMVIDALSLLDGKGCRESAPQLEALRIDRYG